MNRVPMERAGMTSKPRRVALYARVSTVKQDPAPQLAYLREWAARHGLEVAGEFIETASGRLSRRPRMDDVMALVRGHHVHAVAVRKLDRWGRSLTNLRATVDEMVEAGVTFYAVESGITYEKHTPTGKLFLAQLAAFAEFEADLISERTKDALESRTASGEPWVSKKGRTVSKLGRPLEPCHDCGGPRDRRVRGKRKGKFVPLCPGCKGRGAGKGVSADQGAASLETGTQETVVSGNLAGGSGTWPTAPEPSGAVESAGPGGRA